MEKNSAQSRTFHPTLPSLSKRLKAISDEKRLKILSLLAYRSYTVSEIAQELKTDMANLSYHLKQLRDAGFVKVYKDGYNRMYRLNGLYKGGVYRFKFDQMEIRLPLGGRKRVTRKEGEGV